MRMSESELLAYKQRTGIGNAEPVHLVAERKPFKLKEFVPLEKDIKASIMEMIQSLNLGSCTRYNSGALKIDDRYVKFNSAEGHSDLSGVLSPTGRAYFLEVKRPGWNGPVDERELKQAQFLAEQKACGAIAEFVTSVDEALKVLRK
jgi:hypothetical protein